MRKIGLLVIAVLSFTITKAQYTVISDDSAYVPTSGNALLEIYSQNGNKGILVPRLTTAQRTALVTTSPADNSLLVYDTDTKTFWYFDGTSWVEIIPGGTDDQLLTLSNDTLYIENGNGVYLGDFNQTLTFDDVTNQLTISNGNTVIIPDSVNDADSDPTNEIELPPTAVTGQVLTWDGSAWVAQNPGAGADNWGSQVVVSDATLSGDGTSGNPLTVNGDLTDDQQLSLAGSTLSLTDGGSVDLSSINTDNQDLSLSGNTLNITNGSGVDLSPFMDNTDDQNLTGATLTGTTLQIDIENGNSASVDLSSLQDGTGTDNQTLSLAGTNLSISNGNTVSLASFMDNTDNQTLSLTGNTLSISGGNSVDLSGYLDNTDDQNLTGATLTGTTLQIDIENGSSTSVDLSSLQDGTGTDDQNIQGSGLSGTTLTIGIENGTSETVDLSSLVGTDNQDLSLSGNNLNITNGTGVDLSGFMDNTDNQTLSLAGNTLSISGGNSVDLSGYGNDWKLNGNAGTTGGTNFLGTTDNVRLDFRTNNSIRATISNDGNVGIGTTSPGYPLTVTSATASRTGSFINTEASADNFAVYGQCNTSDFYGYGGFFRGGYKGVYATVSPTGSNTYYGVEGEVSGGSGTNYSIRGYASTTGSAYAVYGYANGDAAAYGVYGYGYSGSGTGWIYGVYGYSSATSGTPIGARGSVNDADGYGVYGSNYNATGTGIVAVGNGVSSFSYPTNGGGSAANGDKIGVFGYGQNTGDDVWGGYFSAVNNSNQYSYVGGQFSGTSYKINGTGTVATIVKRNDGTRANMFCPEAPEILFQDYGVGKLVNGKAHIDLDPILSKNIVVNEKHPLRVFIQLEGDCKGVYVTNKSQNGFDVVELQDGNSNVNFTWTVVANRADEFDDNGNRISKNADVRFPDGPAPIPTKTVKVQHEKVNTDNDIKEKQK